jgi:hypothetical protein
MKLTLAILVLSLAAASLPAQTPAPQQKPCPRPEFRQFDFWIGEWEVEANGKRAGRNKITSMYGGCVIEERWEGAGGVAGASFNSFERSTGLWHQAWVDNSGGRLVISGKFENGRMQMSGKRPDGDIDRITWTPNADGTIRQLWETSKDAGKTWATAFDGIYRRAK